MKYFSALLLFGLVLTIHSCKKSEPGSGGPTVITPYTLSAPACIPIRLYMGADEMSIEYDAQKRPVRIILSGELQSTYIYESNRIIANSYDSQGDIESTDYSYLNEFGYMIKEVHQSGTNLDTTYYTYTSDGYLYSRNTKYQIYHYQYENGDLLHVWDINTDFNGTITDSSIVETYTYYNTPSGNFGKFTSWIERNGRPNAHLEKSTIYTFGTNTSKYFQKYDLDNKGNVLKFYQGELEDFSDCELQYQLDWKCD